MASILGTCVTFEKRIPVKAYETIIVSRSKKFSILGHSNRVDMGSITA